MNQPGERDNHQVNEDDGELNNSEGTLEKQDAMKTLDTERVFQGSESEAGKEPIE